MPIGEITQRRLLSERQKVNVKSEKASAAGKASAAAKALKSQEAVPTNVAPELEHGANLEGGNQNQNHKEERKKKEPPAVAGALAVVQPVLPDRVDVEAWKGFCEIRRRKGASMTERAKALVLKKLERSKMADREG